MIDLLQLYGEAKQWRFERDREQPAMEQPKASGGSFPPLSAEDLAEAEKALEDKSACLSAQSRMLESSNGLIQRMLKGDASAAAALLRMAEQVTWVLQLQYRSAPELFRNHIEFMDRVPVIATLRPGWVRRAEESVRCLNLGSKRVSSRLKGSAYKTEHNPCRAWAGWALDVLEQNRLTIAYWQEIPAYLQAGNRPDLELELPPQWVIKSWELPALSKQTLSEWSLLVREMIRDQVPEFHDLPEFKTEIQRIKARTRHRDDVAAGKPLTGTLQTALLDKIVNAMRSIVV